MKISHCVAKADLLEPHNQREKIPHLLSPLHIPGKKEHQSYLQELSRREKIISLTETSRYKETNPGHPPEMICRESEKKMKQERYVT